MAVLLHLSVSHLIVLVIYPVDCVTFVAGRSREGVTWSKGPDGDRWPQSGGMNTLLSIGLVPKWFAQSYLCVGEILSQFIEQIHLLHSFPCSPLPDLGHKKTITHCVCTRGLQSL